MSDSLPFMLAVAGLWAAIGLTLSVVMSRRGHSGFSWLLLGAILGPLAFVLAIDSKRHDETLRATVIPVRAASNRGGPVDVLVGYDGSAQAAAAIEGAARLLGDRLGRLTVAMVVPYDGGTSYEKLARAQLARLKEDAEPAAGITGLEVLHGRPADALREWAAEEGYELIAVGSRGAGLSKRVLGSAAYDLANASKIPVLVVGDE